MKEELLQAIEVGKPVLLVTAIGYIVGIVEAKGELIRLNDVYINCCVSASRVNRFSRGLAVNINQVIGMQLLSKSEKDEMIGGWKAYVAPTAG
ncbi:hypothetical protein ARP74_05410 [Listeria monocytogenes]|nr:hypothetical protein [Listeria monocytogenes]EAD1821614.1 hypothetical protein [Listeria monocytogenes]EAF5564369.1 hypothetical protein [Listeria monocytogenes]EAF5570822.1 hypothetical protein [Listeria monocytogenes]EAG4665195.1 hypothetical protein [Listeria monocytogenes]